ncbi:hypothetical protein NDN08_003160 [Rhodosorus marinus]|uniref:AB hydrolase-1 domain-containing protein n=1 Tax=Rhodosorus marinus TaxID=101924 RepID=A0AAV8UW26_9RHOD|nr:hypothetical protein NDN08_003160 [Rhodosorus marinus]
MVKKRERKRLENIVVAERKVLKSCNAPAFEKRLVNLPSSGELINTLSFGNPSGARHIVFLPGWGSGAALFAKNVLPLSKTYRVHLVDWLGCGGSSRPNFNRNAEPEEASLFFISSLSEWASEFRKLEPSFKRFSIVGHSLGGYLGTLFALKFPQNVDRLMLVSPVGIPARPVNWKGPRRALYQRVLLGMMKILWDRNKSPQSLARTLGSGTMTWLCKRYANYRFPSLEPSAADALGTYFAEISMLPGSGEYGMNTILQFGAWARKPLKDRLPSLTVPVSMIYGERDWMDWRLAAEVIPSMNTKASVGVLEDAGHFLFLDNPSGFNQWLDKELRD